VAAAADKTKKSADADAPKRSRGPLLITLAVALIAAAGAAGGMWYFTQRGHGDDAQAPATASKAPPAPAQYYGLEPPFVVNLNGPADGARYLQVEVQLVTRDAAALESIKTHAPALRARLLMLFSQVAPQDIADRAGKEKLQAASLAEVQKVLEAETGKKCADDLLFTSFVTQ